MGHAHFHNDPGFPAEDPGNQLRAKANGVARPKTPKCFGEILNTASARGMIPGIIDEQDAMNIVHLFFVAGAVDGMPGDEAARLKL
jgi:hypothetical protein